MNILFVMLLLPNQMLIYPLLFTNSLFQEWYGGARLHKEFTYGSKLNDNYEYVLSCKIGSRYLNNEVVGTSDNFKDSIETELIIHDGENEFLETFQNKINSGHRFNYFSLIDSRHNNNIKYTLSKNNKIYKTLELINHDSDYLRIKNKIYDVCHM